MVGGGLEMADTIRSDYPDKYCAHCGNKGCYLLHSGPLMRGKIVYLDSCAAGPLRFIDGKGVEPTFDCETGERLVPESAGNA